MSTGYSQAFLSLPHAPGRRHKGQTYAHEVPVARIATAGSALEHERDLRILRDRLQLVDPCGNGQVFVQIVRPLRISVVLPVFRRLRRQ